MKCNVIMRLLLPAVLLLMPNCTKSSNSNIEKTIESKTTNNQLVVDEITVADLVNNSGVNDVFEKYPEILYLTLKSHPGSGMVALKAACMLAQSDGNFALEVENLAVNGYNLVIDEPAELTQLSSSEKATLLRLLNDFHPVDWDENRKYFE